MGGFGQGLVQGMNMAQDRAMQAQQLKLEKDYAASRQKSMETEDQLKQLQIQSFMKRMEAEQRLPSQQAALLGPQGAPLEEGQQWPMPPEPAPEIDRRKLAMFLQSAADAGQDPNQLMQFMAMADPRMKAIADSIQPPKLEKVGEGEELINPRTGQPVAKGRPKAHVLPPGATLFREGEEQVQAPEKQAEKKPIVASPGQTIIMPDGQQFTIPAAPQKPVAVSPGQQLVDPETGLPVYSAPSAPEKPMVVPPGASLVTPGQTQPSYTAPRAPEKPMAVSPGQSLVKPETGETVFTAPQGPGKPMAVSPGSTVIDPVTGSTIFTAPGAEGAPKPVSDENRHALATFGMPYMSLNAQQQGIINQKILDDKELIAETMAGAGAKARREEKKKEVLPPAQAAELGVPYGTTQEEARGVMPITAQHRDALNAYDTARTIIHDIEQYSEKVNTAASGLMGRAQQSMKLWGAWTQSDPNAALLMSKAGELASVARSLGEKGALANQDVARAAALVPGIMDTREVAVKKIQDMKAIIDQGEANFRKNLGINARQAPPEQPIRKEKEDPYAGIEVPPNLSPKQQKIYKENYLKQREETRKKMQGGTNAPQTQR